MQTDISAKGTSKAMLWTGRILSGWAILFFLFDGVMKLFKPAVVITATLGLGFPESEIIGIGVVALISTVLYAVPRTTVFGAILLTGYLGGAIASKVRIEAPLFDIVFALVFALFIWGGLWLRDPQLRALMPWRRA